MRFVPVKSLEQQSQLLVHRVRQGFVVQRTATINRIRGLLSEFGVVLPLKAATVRREAMRQLEDLPGWANTVIGDLLSEVSRLDERVAQYDRHIEAIAKESVPARQLMQLPGVGRKRGLMALLTATGWLRSTMFKHQGHGAAHGTAPAKSRRRRCRGWRCAG